MFIESLLLKNFRSFSEYHLACDNNVILISGDNGSGKTSIIEALHYACYLSSFRTHSPKDMIAYGHDTFFVKLAGHDWNIQAGCTERKRSIKINNIPAATYKDLIDTYRVISCMEDDLLLIHGSPDYRRQFINQSLLLIDPATHLLLKKYRAIVEQRNAALEKNSHDPVYHDVLTQQLWETTAIIHEKRITFLKQLQEVMHKLVQEFFHDYYLFSLNYTIKKYSLCESYQKFLEHNKNLLRQEYIYKRSLFGAHLDDITILFQNKNSKYFASRGQQKLLVVLLKIAYQIILNKSSLIIIDDFLTDFDDKTIARLMTLLLTRNSQLIITTPSFYASQKLILDYNPQLITLSNSSPGN